jgi:formamidopyrimidine-DNA glycosylase
MPELPEVETTRRGIEPWLVGQVVQAVRVHNPRLRWPVPAHFARRVRGRQVQRVDRRGKYLLLRLDSGETVLWHLGMSGSLRLCDPDEARRPHDHVVWRLSGGRELRFHDPRRFGTVQCFAGHGLAHPLLAKLGPEPLDAAFTGAYLYRRSRGRRLAVKPFLMDAAVVVGVGNIYASEALFRAGIRPDRAAGRIARVRYERLAESVRGVLDTAITRGGTTLRDFVGGDGQPGYFRQSLSVYGRAGAPCRRCGRTLREQRLGQRATVFCPGCQR